MKAEELKDKTIEELEKNLNEEKSKLSQLRFDVKARQTKNYREVRIIKKNIARILTIIKEKQATAEKPKLSKDKE